MAEKRGSKNAIENRGATTFMLCDKCETKKVPYRLVGSGKARMVYECKCGTFDKTGRPA